jgi:hypothetical protein
MCLLWSTNWVFISQKTTFFIVTAVKVSNLILDKLSHKPTCACVCLEGRLPLSVNRQSPPRYYLRVMYRDNLELLKEENTGSFFKHCYLNWSLWTKILLTVSIEKNIEVEWSWEVEIAKTISSDFTWQKSGGGEFPSHHTSQSAIENKNKTDL